MPTWMKRRTPYPYGMATCAASSSPPRSSSSGAEPMAKKTVREIDFTGLSSEELPFWRAAQGKKAKREAFERKLEAMPVPQELKDRYYAGEFSRKGGRPPGPSLK